MRAIISPDRGLAGWHAAPTMVDLDRDGDFDLVVGSEDGSLSYFRNVGSPTAAEFVRMVGDARPDPQMRPRNEPEPFGYGACSDDLRSCRAAGAGLQTTRRTCRESEIRRLRVVAGIERYNVSSLHGSLQRVLHVSERQC